MTYAQNQLPQSYFNLNSCSNVAFCTCICKSILNQIHLTWIFCCCPLTKVQTKSYQLNLHLNLPMKSYSISVQFQLNLHLKYYLCIAGKVQVLRSQVSSTKQHKVFEISLHLFRCCSNTFE